jgi:spore coat polysaccharide biosynthesis protein SpsF
MSGRVVCTIEARMTSSRLPGKVLLPAAGKPLLEHMIERLRRTRHIDAIVIATTEDPSSDPLQALADRLGVGCFRGSEDDVLGRVLGAAQAFAADLIVETTGDCPLIDPETVDLVIERFAEGGADYCSNTLERTYPRGMDVQAFPAAVLAEVAGLTNDRSDREHVSLYIYEHPERYRLRSVVSERPETGEWRLTVDTPEDYELIRTVFDALYRADEAFGLKAILELLDTRPELRELNRHVEQTPARP